ncbi:hypothetical protein FRC01_000120 [Tulasnella sp. 417]|nr:hypothetical protein FRC01_000120 [Tulasnella sp. 417]
MKLKSVPESTKLGSPIRHRSGHFPSQSLNERVSLADDLAAILRRHSVHYRSAIIDCIDQRLDRIKGNLSSATAREGIIYFGGHGEGRARSEGHTYLGSQMDHVELMLFLATNSHRFSGEFWARIVKWQRAAYQQNCLRLLKDYEELTRHITDDRRDIDNIITCLSNAIRKARNQPEPTPEKTTIADVFTIRNIYDDPELKALIESNMFSAERREELFEATEDLVYQEPAFPSECYALLSNKDYKKTTIVDVFTIQSICDDPELKALVESNMFTAERRKELIEAIEDLVYQEPRFPPECYALLSNKDYSETFK